MKTKDNNIIWYWKLATNETDSCLLIAPGLPQYIDKYHPLLKTLSSLSMDTFCLRYSGSWENSGELSVKNSSENINSAISFIKNWKGISLFDNSPQNFSYKKIFLLWFSYGGLPTIFSHYHEDVTKILCCPFTNNKFHSWDLGEKISETVKFLERAYPNVYNISNLNISKELKQLNYDKMDVQSKYILITWKYDKSIPQEEIDWIKNSLNISIHTVVESGHSINLPKDVLFKIFST